MRAKTTKSKKPLKLKNVESVASLFADDLVRYFNMGGDMKNLTAKKVYAKLRGSDEKVYDHADLLADINLTLEESKGFFEQYPYIDDGKISYDHINIMFDFDLSEDDHNFLLDKLDFDEDAATWTTEQHAEYVNDAMKLRGIREEDRYLYLKAVYHNTNEEVDFDELFKSDSDKE
jgi:hypothetical protein